jgi:hypothetical protein
MHHFNCISVVLWRLYQIQHGQINVVMEQEDRQSILKKTTTTKYTKDRNNDRVIL